MKWRQILVECNESKDILKRKGETIIEPVCSLGQFHVVKIISLTYKKKRETKLEHVC